MSIIHGSTPEERACWHPMTEPQFPWEEKCVLLAVFDKDNPDDIAVLVAQVGEHGAFFRDGNMLSVHEEGWIPFAWRPDDMPLRDDPQFSPLLTDYLTEEIEK